MGGRSPLENVGSSSNGAMTRAVIANGCSVGARESCRTVAGPYQREAKPRKRGTFTERPPSKTADCETTGLLRTIGPNRPKPRPTGDFRCETARSNYTPNHVSPQTAQTLPLINFALNHCSLTLTIRSQTDRRVGTEAAPLPENLLSCPNWS